MHCSRMMVEDRFEDREQAGRELARALAEYRGQDVLVLALPRGGLPVAYQVARALGAPLDVCVVRKLGVPGHEELAMGAITASSVVLNEDVVDALRIPSAAISRVAAEERRELERRERLFRGRLPPLDVAGRTAILVDDGLATGATMRAAVAAIRKAGARTVVVAVPVGAPSTCTDLARQADALVCLAQPEPFYAVGAWYDDFRQVTDAEVCRWLERAAEEHAQLGASRAPTPKMDSQPAR
jgi:predicted phosphoribosyltransferase